MTTPQEYGPGLWYAIHSFCGNATSPEKIQATVRWLKATADAFPCSRCEEHLRESMRKRRIEDYTANNERLLYYSYLLHDDANHHADQDNPRADGRKRVSPSFEKVKADFLAIPTPPRGSHHSVRGDQYQFSVYPAFQAAQRSFLSSKNWR